jgi:hypothetical protein
LRSLELQKSLIGGLVARGRGTRAYQENILKADKDLDGAMSRVMSLPEAMISPAQDTDPDSPTFGEWLFDIDVGSP